jgi:hypothetical protein
MEVLDAMPAGRGMAGSSVPGGISKIMKSPDSYFTLQEAQAMVAWLQATFDAIEPIRLTLSRASGRVRQLTTTMQSNGGVHSERQLVRAQKDVQDAEHAIDEHAHAIVERGIILRSVEQGLVDFPAMRDGRIVYLCWVAGENEIKNWHEADTGFGGRQPL